MYRGCENHSVVDMAYLRCERSKRRILLTYGVQGKSPTLRRSLISRPSRARRSQSDFGSSFPSPPTHMLTLSALNVTCSHLWAHKHTHTSIQYAHCGVHCSQSSGCSTAALHVPLARPLVFLTCPPQGLLQTHMTTTIRPQGCVCVCVEEDLVVHHVVC